jgi:acetoin utilization deacetylase AcuC-like enzyme
MSSPALIKDDRYLDHDAGEGHPESPNRLRVIHSLIDAEFSDLPLIAPRLATEEELALIHDPGYIRTVASTTGKLHTQLDPDTGLSARSYEIARLAAGGLLNAVDSLLQTQNTPHSRSALVKPGAGSKPEAQNSVFAFVRPPGHHAEPGRGMGFCIFNNVAIAAAYAKKTYGLKRILIADWDLHHGNGTQRAFYEDPAVLFFSSHQYPYYPGSGNYSEVGSGKGEGFTVNAPFPAGFGDAEYLAVYDRILKPIAMEFKPELVLVSAGFDPYVKDPLGGMGVTGAGFGGLAAMIRDIAEQTCGGRVLITLEGGYNPEGLREGVRAVLNAFAQPRAAADIPAAPAAGKVIQTIISHHNKYWESLR